MMTALDLSLLHTSVSLELVLLKALEEQNMFNLMGSNFTVHNLKQ